MTTPNYDLVVFKSKTAFLVTQSLTFPITVTVLEPSEGGVIQISINDTNSETSHWVNSYFDLVNKLLVKGEDVKVLIENMILVTGHKEAYYVPNSKGLFVNSILAHIGHTLKKLI